MSPLDRRQAWAKATTLLGLILLAPLLLQGTGISMVAKLWSGLLLLAIYTICAFVIFGAMLGASLPALQWLERHLRAWVAWFARDPEALWLHWARHAHYPASARAYLDRAVRLGGREAVFHEALVFLEGGMGAGGQAAGVARLRRAAQRGHPEAAFRLAEALRTGEGSVRPELVEAESWYLRAATLGFGPAAAWLAHAYQAGDGVPADEAKAQAWSGTAELLRPYPQPSHSLLRHEAGPGDPLVRLSSWTVHHAEGAAGHVVANRVGRWALLLLTAGLSGLALLVVGALFWAGSSGLFHLPLLMASPLILMLLWQAWQLRKDGPRSGRDRLLEAAEGGDPEACYQLGLAHRQGRSRRPKDDLTAALWFRKAAEAGHSGAMAALAEAYLGGHGVLRDPREATRWAEAARRESTS